MADPKLKYIIQWLQNGAPNAKDLRVKFFKGIFQLSTIEPHSLHVRKVSNNQLLIKLKLQYSSPDISALKKKRISMVRQSKDLQVMLEPEVDGRVFISHSRDMTTLTLEEVLALWNLYLVFSDVAKAKLFHALIQEETKL